MCVCCQRQELCAASSRLVVELLEAKKQEHARRGDRWSDADMMMSVVDVPPKAGKPSRVAVQWDGSGSCSDRDGKGACVDDAGGPVLMKLHAAYLDKLSTLYRKSGSESDK